MSVKQRTINESFTLYGVGLHTGVDSIVTFKPAAENHGYKIKRTDLDGEPIIAAVADYVKFVDRSSCLDNGELQIYTLEHALSALYGCGIDNCLIELNSCELPILDGSARLYVEQINKVGIKEQEEIREYFVVKEKISYKDEESGTEIVIIPDDDFSVNVLISYDSPYLSNQYAVFDKTVNYSEEIAPCRTFVFLRELEFLYSNNLIKGGDLENAIVIVDREVAQDELDRLASLFNHDKIEVKQGVLNNLDLSFDNEPARHKLLDVMGDIALCGKFIKGRIIATKPGHKANTAIAKIARKIIRQHFNKDRAPEIDIYAEPVMDVNKIKTLLPHRPPFLLVDKVMEITETSIIGVKNVTMNEPFFVGHFPDEPVMPGVLQVEAMAQCGGLLVLNSVEDPENYSTYFLTQDKIKFRRKVVPGDTLVFKLEYLGPMRRGVAHMKGRAYCGNKLVSEAEFMAQVVRNK
ncbi:MAG: bifunctional UDP-3-O-[3-hydroxymyristoyl] N-acetylglucosamine deacetylase/3-hydroxyacyl-ACP dehydratase [Marinifilaceae bacterium]